MLKRNIITLCVHKKSSFMGWEEINFNVYPLCTRNFRFEKCLKKNWRSYLPFFQFYMRTSTFFLSLMKNNIALVIYKLVAHIFEIIF